VRAETIEETPLSGSIARRQAIDTVVSYEAPADPLNFAATPANEIFGCNVFNRSVMKQRLPKAVYKSLVETIDEGSPTPWPRP